MARLTHRSTRETWDSIPTIQEKLRPQGITYERWELDRMPGQKGQTSISNEEVLEIFGNEVAALQASGSYQSADVIQLSPSTPNLDGLLEKFRPEHFHEEDEVRFVVSGRGVFTVRDQAEELWDIEVSQGDLLVVPAGTWHWFDLCEERAIRCIRLFTSTQGWTPVYKQVEQAE